MMPENLNRAFTVLGAVAVASCAFALTTGASSAFNLIHVRGLSIAVLAVFGILAIIGGLIKLRSLALAAALGFLVSAVLQLIQLGQPANLLGGDGSTMSLFGALGIGLASIWLAGRTTASKG